MDRFENKSDARKALRELESRGRKGDADAYLLIADYYMIYKELTRFSDFLDEIGGNSTFPHQAESALKKAMALGSEKAHWSWRSITSTWAARRGTRQLPY